MPLQTSDLKKYCCFSKLSDHSLDMLSHNFKMVSFPKGTEVLKEGEPAQEFYFVQQGRLEVTKRTKHGDTKLSVISSGQGFGEVALLTNALRSATVRALTD